MCSYTSLLTCSELKIVNSHAKTVVLSLTVRIPKAHVSPSRGSSTADAVNMDLHVHIRTLEKRFHINASSMYTCEIINPTLQSFSPCFRLAFFSADFAYFSTELVVPSRGIPH